MLTPSGGPAVRTLLVDNLDSFTYNLYDLLTQVNGTPPTVVRNDVDWHAIDWDSFDNVVVSPGPGTPTEPDDFGVSARIVAECDLPLLGVCLGHQGLAAHYGGRVRRAREPMHGRRSVIVHDGRDLFDGVPSPMTVVRYHSLVAADLPDDLEAVAWTYDGTVMAVRHKTRPAWGLQFHPESIAGEHGRALLANFRDRTRAVQRRCVDSSLAQTVSRRHPTLYRVESMKVDVDPRPEQVFDALFATGERAFWLDGSAHVERSSRFTIMGDCAGPRSEYVTYDVERAVVEVHRRGLPVESVRTSIFDYLHDELNLRRVEPDPALPFDFHLGFVGYLGYELKAETGGAHAHASPHPDAALVFADRAVVLDHVEKCCYVMVLHTVTGPPEHDEWFARTAAVLARLDTATPVSSPGIIVAESVPDLRHGRAEYRRLIGECQELIGAGETYEVCLTNMATAPVHVEPVPAFQHLRAINPMPYAALLAFGELSAVSASPERFLRVTPDRTLESKPIKGTRPRGATAEQDVALRRELIGSEKERAENLMIVDLVRNDMARVCEAGTVHVPALFDVETYSSVHQMVSTVRGTLRDDTHVVDAIRALFPGGSMTGAPKVRTMAILDRLEGGARGIYSGALGYLSLSGTADLSIVIRTLVISAAGVEYGVGGAVTALSDPDEEYAETLVKSATFQHVLGHAAVPVS